MSRCRLPLTVGLWMVCLFAYLAYCGRVLSTPVCDHLCHEIYCNWTNSCLLWEYPDCAYCDPSVSSNCSDNFGPGNNRSCIAATPPPFQRLKTADQCGVVCEGNQAEATHCQGLLNQWVAMVGGPGYCGGPEGP